jgi:large repetitive protein
MATPQASTFIAPIINSAYGANHQTVTASVPNFIPSHDNPVPVASAVKGGAPTIAYSETVTVQGGTSPFTFAVTSGALPTGTTLNTSSGVISGTPTATGTFSFTITVTDSLGFTGSYGFQISIAAPAGGEFSLTFLA